MTRVDSITIRPASSADAGALDRLAGLDSKRLPSDDDFLIAEVAGEPRAAVGINTGTVVADPFHPTGEVADLLRLYAKSRQDGGATRRRAPRVLDRLIAAAGRAPHRPPESRADCSA